VQFNAALKHTAIVGYNAKKRKMRVAITMIFLILCTSIHSQSADSSKIDFHCSSENASDFIKSFPDSFLMIKNYLDHSCWTDEKQINHWDTIPTLCFYISVDNLHNLYINSNYIPKQKEDFSYGHPGAGSLIYLDNKTYGICKSTMFESILIPIKIVDLNHMYLIIDRKEILYKRLND
jgi:hypothetical protein